ncbi:MAG: hypothetical protein AAGF84_06320 [Planctomycetota bacterium]
MHLCSGWINPASNLMADFLPRRDADFANFCAAFAEGILAPPGPEALGISVAQAAAYAQNERAFAEALAAANAPTTRGPWTIARKDEARKALAAETRTLAKLVRAQPGVSLETLYRLGLGKRCSERPIDANDAPRLHVLGMDGDTLRLRLMPQDGDRVRLPAGALGAAVYAYAGASIPTRLIDWRLLNNTTRPRCAFRLPEGLAGPGDSVWVTGRWLDRRLQAGAWSKPVQTYLPMSPTLRIVPERLAA